MTDRL